MKDLRQFVLGILAALLSLGLVLGSVSMAITEGNILAFAPTLTFTPTLTLIPTLLESTPAFTATPALLAPGVTLQASLTPSLTWTPSINSPAPTQFSECVPPPGWFLISIQLGDTLSGLAAAYRTTEDLLAQANCLITSNLMPGGTLYVPAQPTITPSVQCGPPPGWVLYVIQYGDTLSHLAQIFKVSVYDLQLANCMGNTTLIRAGHKMYVPNRPTPTSTPTATRTQRPPDTATPTMIPTITLTFTPVILLPTDTSTPQPTRTWTPLPPTSTPTPTPVTPTFTPTNTPEAPTPTLTPSGIISGTVLLVTYPYK